MISDQVLRKNLLCNANRRKKYILLVFTALKIVATHKPLLLPASDLDGGGLGTRLGERPQVRIQNV